jgi:FkbM family methyltransferase
MPTPKLIEHRIANVVRASIDQRAGSQDDLSPFSAAQGLSLSAIAYLSTRLRTLTRRSASERFELPLGFEMDLDLSDVPQLYMALFGIWEPSQTSIVQRIMREDRVFVDIGAHVGYYTLLAAALGAQVRAFEPDPTIASMLRRNVQLNAFEASVHISEVAVAADSDGRTLYRGPRHNRGLTSTSSKWNLEASGTVESAPIGELLTEEILAATQIIKIDVEGTEPAVVEGLGRVGDSLATDAVVLVELSPRWWQNPVSIEEVLSPLTTRGFRPWTLENSYSPKRYLTPQRVHEPHKVALADLSTSRRRYDLLLAVDESAFSSGQ